LNQQLREGFIIQVKGYKNLPFAAEEVESVTVTEKRRNFRRKKEDRPKATQLLRRIGRLHALIDR
jgi:hypothetical protein